mgnify:CR=1 FL=1
MNESIEFPAGLHNVLQENVDSRQHVLNRKFHTSHFSETIQK